MEVVDKNTCRHCRRPIERLEGIGWLHGELMKYADMPISCESAEPIDPRCPVCSEVVPAMSIGGGYCKLSRHGKPTCAGSGTQCSRPE